MEIQSIDLSSGNRGDISGSGHRSDIEPGSSDLQSDRRRFLIEHLLILIYSRDGRSEDDIDIASDRAERIGGFSLLGIDFGGRE